MSYKIGSVINSQDAENLATLTEEALCNNDVQAQRLASELVEMMQILHGPCHIEVGVALFYLALALEEQDKVAQAMKVRKRARNILFGQAAHSN